MRIRLVLAGLLLSIAAFAQDDKSFAGWTSLEVTKSFPKAHMYLYGYLEHDNYYYKRFDCFYGRFSVGVKPLPWLKAGVNYVPVLEDNMCWTHKIEFDAQGTLKSGQLKVSLRERMRIGIAGSSTRELRSRLKAEYSFPGPGLVVYLAPEVFTWGTKWLKTRHYAGINWYFHEKVALDLYYLYYTFAEGYVTHALGVGIIVDL